MTTTEKGMASMTETIVGERAELLAALTQSRYFLRNTTRDLTDEQAAASPTVSALCLGGLIKHVARTESGWVDFILEGGSAMAQDGKDWIDWDESDWAKRDAEFRMLPGETLGGLLEDYERVAQRTEEVVASLPDLDVSHELPAAPWFEPGTRLSARRVLMNLIAETSQHAGHADIIREAIDGAKSMG